MVDEHHVSVKRACQVARLSRAAYYKPGIDWEQRDRPVMNALDEVVTENGRWGFWKCFDRLRLQQRPWNHKRVHRVYCAMGLNMKRRTKKRVPARERVPLTVPSAPNQVWAIDFMHDTLYGRRSFRSFNVIDEADRHCLGIDLATSIPAVRVTRFMEQLVDIHGKPAAVRCDNGPEFISHEFMAWCAKRDIKIVFIQPGKPDQNAFIERFNRSYREEVLDAHIFNTLEDVREITDDWIITYNEIRPHDALGSLPPALYRERMLVTTPL